MNRTASQRMQSLAPEHFGGSRRASVYQALISAVASGATGQDTIQIQSDSAFQIEALAAAVYVSNVLVASPYATVQLTDGGSDSTMFSEEIALPAIFGDAKQPMILPTPYILRPSTTLGVKVTNVFSAAASTFYFAFIGSKVK